MGGGRAWGEAESPASLKRGRAGGCTPPEVWQSRWELGRTRSLTRKQRGEMAEAAFLAKAAALGFRVAKPWGESSRYDLVVDNGKRLIRVQVKSAHRAWAA
jgi:PD-(D/E)XK endonuclease